MDNTNRREFIKFGAAGGLATLSGTKTADATDSKKGYQVRLGYPDKYLCLISELQINEPFSFSYPDKESPCLLIKFSVPQKSGVGPNADILAFSQLCTHLGCPVFYSKEQRALLCPCHFTQFDPEKNGKIICGQATRNLPRILLRYDETKQTISAVGIDGMIYGRQANII